VPDKDKYPTIWSIFVSVIKSWLERAFLVKTFEEGLKEDNLEDSIHDMHQLLGQEATKPAKNHE
jgi:hypothetical protein